MLLIYFLLFFIYFFLQYVSAIDYISLMPGFQNFITTRGPTDLDAEIFIFSQMLLRFFL